MVVYVKSPRRRRETKKEQLFNRGARPKEFGLSSLVRGEKAII